MKLFLVRGIPGSGKTTVAKELASVIKDNSIHLEADMYFDHDGEYKFDANKLGAAHGWCQTETREYLKLNFTVIVSNTFTTIKELRPYFDIANEFGIVPSVILAQNQFNNVHGVPEEVLQKMKQRFAYDLSELFQKSNSGS